MSRAVAPSVAVVVASWFKVALEHAGANLREQVVGPLGADVLIFLTYRQDEVRSDSCDSAETCGVRWRFRCLEPIARIEMERQLTTLELAQRLEGSKDWHRVAEAYGVHGGCVRHNSSSTCKACFADSARSPYRCSKPLPEGGNTFFAPVLGKPNLNVLRQLHMQARVLQMLVTHEATARQAHGPYAHVVWARLEFSWLRPHPSLSQLGIGGGGGSGGGGSCLWVPLGEDYAGLNDRHALMPRAAAPVYLGRWNTIVEGKLPEEIPQMFLPPHLVNRIPAQSSERFLAAHLAHHNVSVCRFPPTAYLQCCKAGAAADCYKPQCHHHQYASAIRNRSFDADTRRLLAGKYPQELATAIVHASALDLEGTRLSLRAMSWPYAGHWHAQLLLGHSLVAHVPGTASGEWAHVIKTPLKTIKGFAWTLIRRASVFQGELVATARGPETADANASRQCTAAELQGAPHNRSLGLKRGGHAMRKMAPSGGAASTSASGGSGGGSGGNGTDDGWAPSACGVRLEYHASPWEESWRAYVTAHPEYSRGWAASCSRLKNESRLVETWTQLWAERATLAGAQYVSAHQAWDKGVFSYHVVRDGCSGAELRQIPLEPLVSFLRHPRHHCFNVLSYKYNKNYLVPLWAFEMPPPRGRRCLFFDLGASLYNSGTGGASQQWFVETYARRGAPFDRILAWEAHNMTAARIFGVVPSAVFDRLSYYNLPVDPTPGAKLNPWRTLKNVAHVDDLVVVKLDIDNSPIEELLVAQLLEDREISSRVDDFYFEHHVLASPMYYEGWHRGPKLTRTLAQSYETFTRLRELGIRAHSWV